MMPTTLAARALALWAVIVCVTPAALPSGSTAERHPRRGDRHRAPLLGVPPPPSSLLAVPPSPLWIRGGAEAVASKKKKAHAKAFKDAELATSAKEKAQERRYEGERIAIGARSGGASLVESLVHKVAKLLRGVARLFGASLRDDEPSVAVGAAPAAHGRGRGGREHATSASASAPAKSAKSAKKAKGDAMLASHLGNTRHKGSMQRIVKEVAARAVRLRAHKNHCRAIVRVRGGRGGLGRGASRDRSRVGGRRRRSTTP